MTYSIEYFHAKVQATVVAWPVDVVADYARIVELLIELRPRGKSGIGRAFYCFLVGQRVVMLHAFIKETLNKWVTHLGNPHGCVGQS